MVKLTFGKKPNDEPPPEAPSRKPSMKISFKPQTPATEQAPTLPSPAEAPKPKIKMVKKEKKGGDDGEEDELHSAPTLKRAPTILKIGSKRARNLEDAAEGELPAKRQVKPTERAGSLTFRVPSKPVKAPTLKLNTKLHQPVKLKLSSASAAAQSATTPLIKIKARGRVPKRDPGVGYDSEDEDAEVDPVIENHFILRMQPGEDCDYLRAAIVESGLKHTATGHKPGGPDVWFKFFDKEGRHGLVSVRGHMYAASLLDLPCIIEAQKSWDRKGWYKTTDICQILLVLGRIEKEEQAKDYPLPSEVDKVNWQYPHGLTPPMQWVRKRRFRKRVNRRHIERVEADVEELLKKDKLFEEGAVDAQIDVEWAEDENQEYADGDEMDAEGEEDEFEYEYQDEDGNVYTQEPEPMEQDAEADDDDLEAQLLQGLEEDEDPTGEGGTALIGDASMLQASPDVLVPLETAVTPASGIATSVTEDDDDDEEDDDDEDEAAEEEDEEERARRIEREQIEAEIADIKAEIAQSEAQFARQTNPLLKGKIRGTLEKLRADLQVKQSGLGLNEE